MDVVSKSILAVDTRRKSEKKRIKAIEEEKEQLEVKNEN